MHGDAIYIGGEFTNIGGADRNKLAKIQLSDGQSSPGWVSPGLTAPVPGEDPADVTELFPLTFAVDGDDVFVGGTFVRVAGVLRCNSAKLDATTGAVQDPWYAFQQTGTGERILKMRLVLDETSAHLCTTYFVTSP